MKLKFWLTALVLVLALVLPPAVAPPQPALADVAGTLWQLAGVDAANNPNLTYINLSNVVSFDQGYSSDHNLVVKEDGTVWAWGYNDSGQLGNGTTSTRYSTTPVQVVGAGASGFLTNVKAATAGDGWSVAVKNDGTVWAWGGNGWGMLGTGAGNQGEGGIAYSTTPVQVHDDAGGFLQNVTAVSAGMDHTLALKTDGTVWGWGGSGWGQLGNGTTGNHYGSSNTYYISHPVQASGLTDVKSICASNAFSVVLKNDGSVWTFGCNTWSNLGINKSSSQVSGELSPVQVLGIGGSGFLSGIDGISARGTHVLAFQNSSGNLYGWGSNWQGALAQTNTSSYYAAPFVVATIPGSTSGGGAIIISAGLGYSLVKNPGGTLTGWGDGFGTPGTSVNVNIVHDVTNISGQLILGPDRIPTTTTITSSSQPSYAWDDVTFTATVTGAGGIPTGVLYFLFEGGGYGTTTTLNNAGQAFLSGVGGDMHPGSIDFVAKYNGDYNYAQSTSVTYWQTVNKLDCTAVLTSSPNPSLVGDTVTYTLTVSHPPDKSVPTGNWVDFTGGYPSILLDTTGIVVFTDSTLAAGSYYIKATYRGDDNYNTCDSNEITQVVNEQPPPPPPAGLAWTTTGGEINTSRIHALVYDSVRNLLYAGMCTGIDGSEKNGVWCYNGSTWTSTGGDLSDYDVRALAYDQANNILYAGTNMHGVWRYDGSIWTSISDYPTDTYTVWSLAYDSTEDIIYEGTEANGVGYYYGVHWNIDSPGNVGGGPGAILSLVYDPDLQVLYAGTDSTGAGVEKFDGATWSQLGDDLQSHNVYSLALDTTHNVLYAGTDINGVWVYNGTSWTRTSGFNSFESILSLAYYPAVNLVYAGTGGTGTGVWSYDGASWTSTGGYISSFEVQALACDSTHNILYAGTTDHGVWSTPISAPPPPPPTSITFPDPNLEAAIRAAINIPSGDIYQSDLDNLTSLSADNAGIADLTGLEHCTNLQQLDLPSNQIADISALSNLAKLQSLDLNDNQIVSLDALTGHVTLQRLDLDWNQITDISPIASLNNLTYLDLSFNQIGNISPLTNLAKLKTLILDGNSISNLNDLSNLTSLTILWAGCYQITSISPLANLTNLTELHVDHTYVNDLSPLANLTKLEVISFHSLGNNPRISDISVLANLPNLWEVNLESNLISDLTPLANLPKLTWLFLSDNPISNLTPLAGLSNLEDLSLDMAPLSDISVISNFTKMRSLSLFNDQIADLTPLANLNNLDILNLEFNKIDTISTLVNLQKIRVIFLHYNYLDISPGSQNMADIQSLLNRGVNVVYTPQNLMVTTASPLPDGQVGVDYSQSLDARWGTSPYTWEIISGSPPDGLSLSGNTITGKPTTAGTTSFTVNVTDTTTPTPYTATKTMSLTINPALVTLSIVTPSPLPDGQVGVYYSLSLDATGGTHPYIWSIQSGNLPPELSLTFNTISGTPSTAGAYSFTVQVIDKDGLIATRAMSLTINPAPVTLSIDTPSPLPDGQMGVCYSLSLDASGGKPSYIWSIQGGNLPPDLSLTFRNISGTPSTAGTYSFTVQVLDEDGTIVTKIFSLTIAPLNVVTIEVTENIGVNDSCQVLPPAVIDLVETIGVSDSCQALPPAVIDLVETIGVSDSILPLPAASIDIVESISVVDQETAVGSGTLPTTVSISPTSRFKGYSAFSLTVTGTNFSPASVVRFAGGDRPTTFISSTQLTASIPATDLKTAGHFNITVYDAAGGGESNPQTFTVYSLGFQLHSPVDLYLTDPDGLHIGLDPATNQTVNQIADADYSGPGTEPEFVNILTLKTGNYVITVIPRAGVSPTDTYTLTATFDGNTVVLADNIPIGNIPGQGYTITINAPTPPPPPPPGGGGGFLYVSLTGLKGTLVIAIDGITLQATQLVSQDDNVSLSVPYLAKLLNNLGSPLTTLSMTKVSSPPAPPPEWLILSAYDFGPNGAQFSPALTITMRYDPETLPQGASENDLFITYWNGSQWVALVSTVDTDAHTVSAAITHSTNFAVMSKLAPGSTPTPTPITAPTPTATSSPVPTTTAPPTTVIRPTPSLTTAPTPTPSLTPTPATPPTSTVTPPTTAPVPPSSTPSASNTNWGIIIVIIVAAIVVGLLIFFLVKGLMRR